MSAHDAGIYALETAVQNYAWGSRTALATMRGEGAPSAKPEAELWIGAHPQGPSRVRSPGPNEGLSLERLIAGDPAFMLGRDVHARFGARLPLLLKILAAEQPLSLQTHPTQAQAAAGFAREESLGVARDAPNRMYRDASHKPELLCALTPFDALCGFRDAEELLFQVQPALGSGLYRAALGPMRSGRDWASQVRSLLGHTKEQVAKIAAEVLPRAARLASEKGPFAKLGSWLLRAHEIYGDDPGLLVVPMMNLVQLAPGEAVFLPAGNLHAYLQGTGVEVMASSDNVLRGGLTPKHVDAEELVRVLDFRAGPVSLARADARGGALVYESPVEEFSLARIGLDEEGPSFSAEVRGPELLVCTEGRCAVLDANGARVCELSASGALFVAHGAVRYALDLRGRGPATVFRARVPAAGERGGA